MIQDDPPPFSPDQDLYVFVSEQETFGDFNDSDSLVWMKEGLEYGDWYSGPNGDGTFTFSASVTASEVGKTITSPFQASYFF